MNKIELSDNVHPNSNGSPWGWIVYKDSPRTRLATYSGFDEKARCQQMVDVVNAGYDHAAAELRWIPVKTKYPDRPGIYDVTLWDGTISKSAYYVGTFDKSVIAWMPMPTKPYTEPADKIAEVGERGEINMKLTEKELGYNEGIAWAADWLVGQSESNGDEIKAFASNIADSIRSHKKPWDVTETGSCDYCEHCHEMNQTCGKCGREWSGDIQRKEYP